MNPPFKKIYFIVLCLAISFSGCRKFNDGETPGWDFPVKPGSEKWKTFQSYAEKLEACQIPGNIFPILQTGELLEICLNYPLLMDILAFNFLSDGFEAYETNFNGFRELLSREDAGVEALAYYKKTNPASAAVYSSISFVFNMSVVELILSHRQIVDKFNPAQKREAVAELLAKLNAKKQSGEDYPGYFCQVTNYLAMISIIKSDSTSNQASGAKKLIVYFGGNFLPDKYTIAMADQIISKYLAGE